MTTIYEATVPSNIAFMKYWGKRDSKLQWPANDSLSMTLHQIHTRTSAQVINAKDHQFLFNGQRIERTDQRFQKAFHHLDRMAQEFGFENKLDVTTVNNFPMGAGIASSASGLAALTLSAITCWNQTTDWDALAAQGFDRQHLAHIARRGSGSAGRSLFGGFVVWEAGASAAEQRLKPLYSADHWPLADAIVLFTQEEKSLSSSKAHAYAWSSPLFETRLAGIPERLAAMRSALERRDLAQLGPLLEAEALEMHAVIMTAQPAHTYLAPESLAFLAQLRQARLRGAINAYFTIDAGPNIHIIHEERDAQRLKSWLEGILPTDRILYDTIGHGPTLRTCRG